MLISNKINSPVKNSLSSVMDGLQKSKEEIFTEVNRFGVGSYSTFPKESACIIIIRYIFFCVALSLSTVHPVLGSKHLSLTNKYFEYWLCYNQSQGAFFECKSISKEIIVYISSLNNLFFSWRHVSYFEMLIFKPTVFLC